MRRLVLALAIAIASLSTQAAPAPEPVPAHESLRITSTALGETRRINVYLPPDYDRCGDCRYPVLYMPDGGLAEDFPHVATAVDGLIRSGEVRPMLVVGIENTVRRRDMTGPTQALEDARVTDQPGGSARFRAFIARELQPVVRTRYRVDGDDAVLGESLAGLFIVETMMLEPRLFDTYAALDPSLWWNAGQWVREAPARLQAWDGTPVRLYVASAGVESNSKEVTAFVDALRLAPATVTWHHEARPDLRHDTIYRRLEKDVLRALFPAR